MNSDTLRLYKSIHTWTGIVAGLLLFISFYAGALTMFGDVLDRWARPPAAATAPLDPARAEELIARTLAARPEAAKEFTLHLADDAPAPLTWRRNREDRTPWTARLGPGGELVLAQSREGGLGRFVDNVHRSGGIPGDPEIGEHVMGVVSLVYGLALVSGLVVLLPSLVKDFFALRIGANLKRMWLDAHNLVGIASLPFHLVIALTAVVFGLHDQFYDAQDQAVYGGQLRTIMKATNPLATLRRDPAPAAMLPPARLLEAARAHAPGFIPVALEYRNAGSRSAVVRVVGRDPARLARATGFMLLGAVGGEVLSSDYVPELQDGWSAVVSSFFALHFGSYGGETVRWSYFFLGLSGAFLFYSGNLLWVESRRRSERRHGAGVVQGRAPRLMAAGTVGACLGCVAGLFVAVAAERLLAGRIADPAAWREGLYYGAFVLFLAWAFLRGAARAAPALLTATALCALALPVLSLALDGSAEPGVDVAAFTAALGLFRLGRLSARRATEGPVDSVWSRRPAGAGRDAADNAAA